MSNEQMKQRLEAAFATMTKEQQSNMLYEIFDMLFSAAGTDVKKVARLSNTMVNIGAKSVAYVCLSGYFADAENVSKVQKIVDISIEQFKDTIYEGFTESRKLALKDFGFEETDPLFPDPFADKTPSINEQTRDEILREMGEHTDG